MNVAPFAIDLEAPLETASGDIEARNGFLVRCSHRGVAGVGEATPLPGWTESYEDCERALADAADAASERGLKAARRSLPDDAVAARHGVATAMLDADARAEGLSLAAWFGQDSPASSVPVNATIGDGSPAETASAAREVTEAGFGCLKVKVGAGPIERDLARLRALRRAVEEAVTLRADANGAWSRSAALNILDDLADLGVATLEQPLPPANLEGHAALREGPVEIALDESLAHHDAATVLDAGAADALVLKPMVLGGPGAAYAIASRCHDGGVAPIISTTVDAVVARTAAVHVAAALPEVRPSGLATADRLATDLGPDPAPVSDGRAAVPDGPGLGLTEVSADG